MGVSISFLFLVSPEKIRLLTMQFRDRGFASVGTVFADSITADGLLEESGSPEESTSTNFWLNSGAYFYETGSISNTIQGEVDQASTWYTEYKNTNPEDSDGGLHPQNIFRLISRSDWDNTEQQVYFKVKKYNLSESSNRNASNGLLLMSRYQDDNNLYYFGVRVDGNLVIKKKQNGTYYTIAEQKFFDGEYSGTESIIPQDVWIGIKAKVVTLDDGSVSLVLSTDLGNTGEWIEQITTIDNGKDFGDGVIAGPAHVGIRTDFMDVLFTGYRTEEIDPNVSVETKGTFTLSVSVINDDNGNENADTFSFSVNDTSIKNGESLQLEEGEYPIATPDTDYTISYSDACSGGLVSIVKNETVSCTVTLNDVASSSGGGGGGNTPPEEDSSLKDILDDESPEQDNSPLGSSSDPKGVEEKVPDKVAIPKIKSDEDPAKVLSVPSIIAPVKGEQLEALIDTLPVKKILSPSGTVVSSIAPEQVLEVLDSSVETRSLYYGVRSPEVKVLQAFLSTDKTIYPSQYVTGYYGPLTLKAVKAFQKKHGVLSGFEFLMPRFGIVGPKTIEKINEIYSNTSTDADPLFSFVKGE